MSHGRNCGERDLSVGLTWQRREVLQKGDHCVHGVRRRKHLGLDAARWRVGRSRRFLEHIAVIGAQRIHLGTWRGWLRLCWLRLRYGRYGWQRQRYWSSWSPKTEVGKSYRGGGILGNMGVVGDDNLRVTRGETMIIPGFNR